ARAAQAAAEAEAARATQVAAEAVAEQDAQASMESKKDKKEKTGESETEDNCDVPTGEVIAVTMPAASLVFSSTDEDCHDGLSGTSSAADAVLPAMEYVDAAFDANEERQAPTHDSTHSEDDSDVGGSATMTADAGATAAVAVLSAEGDFGAVEESNAGDESEKGDAASSTSTIAAKDGWINLSLPCNGSTNEDEDDEIPLECLSRSKESLIDQKDDAP
ncbi:hypothetical protein PFISCL1PPCAC_2676, partial [Pristionchus fissidentatus]